MNDFLDAPNLEPTIKPAIDCLAPSCGPGKGHGQSGAADSFNGLEAQRSFERNGSRKERLLKSPPLVFGQRIFGEVTLTEILCPRPYGAEHARTEF